MENKDLSVENIILKLEIVPSNAMVRPKKIFINFEENRRLSDENGEK